MRTKEIGISLPEDLINEVDNRRGLIPRSRYIRCLIENSFKKAAGGDEVLPSSADQVFPAQEDVPSD